MRVLARHDRERENAGRLAVNRPNAYSIGSAKRKLWEWHFGLIGFVRSAGEGRRRRRRWKVGRSAASIGATTRNISGGGRGRSALFCQKKQQRSFSIFITFGRAGISMDDAYKVKGG